MPKNLVLFLSLVLLFQCSAAQNRNSIQSDSVYKVAHVRIRETYYVETSSKAKEITVFDADGNYIAFMLTDNETGLQPQLKIWFTYDANHIVGSETDTIYSGNRIAIKNSEVIYNSKGQLIKKTLKNNGNITSEITYYPDEKKETERLYRSGTVYREQTSYYDERGKTIRFVGNEIADPNAQDKTFMVNGKPIVFKAQKNNSTWDYTFKNTYDGGNRLIDTKRFENNEQKDETEYVYDKAGLLTEERDAPSFGHLRVIRFNYLFFH